MRKLNIVFFWTLTVVATISLVNLVGSGQAFANYLKISPSSIGKTQVVNVGLNKSYVVDLPGDAHDILVANPDVADAITRTSRRIYLFGKQVGNTNLFIFDSSGNQLLNLDIRIERDVSGLEENLKKYIPGSDIKVEVVSDNIILTGTVPTPQASARAVQLARAFISGGEATTNQFNSSFGGDASNGGTVFVDQEARQESQIVNLLRIDGDDQVHLKVTIAEIQRTIVKQLGIDLTAAALTAGEITLAGSTGNPFGLGYFQSGTGFRIQDTTGAETIDGVLRALDQAGVMRTLAEPSLTAVSGESASFAVGGEYRVTDGSTADDAGNVTITSRTVEYGVSLSFTPVVLGPGRISLRIRTEVSEPTSEGSTASIGNVNSPGVRRRQAETTVELPSGGSMVLAGLLKDDVRQVSQGFPGLKNVPVLGALFRSRDFQRFETELVVIATPYLVRPVARQQLARPDDNFHTSADGAATFLGHVNRVYGNADGEVPEGRYHGKVGFIFK